MTETIQTCDENQQMFARRLKELRKASGLSQVDLAEKLGVSRGSISNYENCTRIPDITFLCRASDFFSVGTSYLLGKSDQEVGKQGGIHKKIENKILRFYCALTDVYRDEDEREMIGMPSLELSDDLTEDVIAMMLAIKLFIEQTCGDETGDPIDFTHTLNKLAIQYVMEAKDGKTDI